MSLIPVKQNSETKLLRLFRTLSPEDAKSVLDMAEFLASREPSGAPVVIPEPVLTERPESESVVAAIKRLSGTYHMVDNSTVLNETSSLMAQHVMQGRSASEVIDDLEQIFQAQYEKLLGNDS